MNVTLSWDMTAVIRLLVLFGLVAVPPPGLLDIPMMPTRRFRRGPGVAGIALAATLVAAPRIAAHTDTATAPDTAVKAAFPYDFARFAEWPALPSGASIAVCIIGSEQIATAIVETVRGQNISGYTLDVSGPQESAAWRVCHVRDGHVQ
jgi:hypothetical protein